MAADYADIDMSQVSHIIVMQPKDMIDMGKETFTLGSTTSPGTTTLLVYRGP